MTNDRVRRIYATEAVRIPPKTQTDVSVAVVWPTLHPEENDWVVEPTAIGQDLVVARTLVSGDAPNTLVRVINTSDRECCIGCDAEIGVAWEASTTLEVGQALESDEAATAVVSAMPRWMSIRAGNCCEHVECMIDALGDNLTEEQKQAVLEFVKKNVDVFSASEFDLGRTSLLEHRIDLKHDKPVHQALRRHPVAYLPLIDQYVDCLLYTSPSPRD